MTGILGKAPFWLDPDDADIHFPDVELALAEPDGLLAIGGDLSTKRLLEAYQRGIFPWYGQGQPIPVKIQINAAHIGFVHDVGRAYFQDVRALERWRLIEGAGR